MKKKIKFNKNLVVVILIVFSVGLVLINSSITGYQAKEGKVKATKNSAGDADCEELFNEESATELACGENKFIVTRETPLTPLWRGCDSDEAKESWEELKRQAELDLESIINNEDDPSFIGGCPNECPSKVPDTPEIETCYYCRKKGGLFTGEFWGKTGLRRIFVAASTTVECKERLSFFEDDETQTDKEQTETPDEDSEDQKQMSSMPSDTFTQ
ncbi:hypothetical protein HYT58_02265 [Candidatus Woesearchaeota archaeon]|nr:hypothetical protein [Candidatus Woesearchaeota archaeon]